MTKRHSGEGTVRQRANGRWEARLRYEDPASGLQRRVSFYGATAKEARAAMKAGAARLDEGKPVRDASVTLAQVCVDWRTKTLVASGRKETTKVLYAGLLKSHVEAASIATKRLDRLRATDIDGLVIELRAKTKDDGSRQLAESVDREGASGSATCFRWCNQGRAHCTEPRRCRRGRFST